MPLKLITALDFDGMKPVKSLVNSLGDSVEYYKVGLELFVSAGAEALDFLKSRDKKIFLDLKFHDIPNTASKAVVAAARYGADIIDVHVQGGRDMAAACVSALKEACHKENSRPLLVGVTLLTSLDGRHLENFGIGGTDPLEYVVKLAKLAKDSGLDGVVSSAMETAAIKRALGTGFIAVTPGIRPSGFGSADQKRTATPADAKSAGADFIVVGRPITAAADPRKAADEILEELRKA